MESGHQTHQVIAGRYEILRVLGQGGMAITYAAIDRQTKQQVALKVLSLQRMQDFKVLELFEREAMTLRHLNHPAIPQYLDDFQIDQPQNRLFCLVQQLAPGKPLTTLIATGYQPDEAFVRQMAQQVLEVLVYLQQLAPPIIHRDIKPQNLIYNDAGQVSLVDFGAVQNTYHNTLTGSSTVVGTYGYMAPEQFRGQAVLSTDLYGLGTTLLFLLTQKPPSELPQRKLKLDFRPYVQVAPEFANWLDRLIDPIAEARFPSAAAALAVLNGNHALDPTIAAVPERPAGCPITLIRDGDTLLIRLPQLWLHSLQSRQLALLSCTTIAMLGFLLYLIPLIWVPLNAYAPWVIWVLYGSYCLLAVFFTWVFLRSATIRVRLQIRPQDCHVSETVWWGRRERTLRFAPDGPAAIAIKPTRFFCKLSAPVKVVPVNVCVLAGKYRFGLFLKESEKTWLAAEVQDFIQKSSASAISRI